MIGREALEQILAQYDKHGWTLRRVLVSDPGLGVTDGIFGGVEVRPSQLNGLWFSRSSRPGVTAWELRHLSATPYALVENIQEGTEKSEAELVLKRTETKMLEIIRGRTAPR
jgi:hypothetical protein